MNKQTKESRKEQALRLKNYISQEWKKVSNANTNLAAALLTFETFIEGTDITDILDRVVPKDAHTDTENKEQGGTNPLPENSQQNLPNEQEQGVDDNTQGVRDYYASRFVKGSDGSYELYNMEHFPKGNKARYAFISAYNPKKFPDRIYFSIHCKGINPASENCYLTKNEEGERCNGVLAYAKEEFNKKYKNNYTCVNCNTKYFRKEESIG